MGKKAQKKEQIASLRFWLGTCIASLLAIIGFIATHYKSADLILICSCIIAGVFLSISSFLFNAKINLKIKELGDL